MSMYVSEPDFVDYHNLVGESCDYVAMRSEMASAFDGVSFEGLDFSGLSWLDTFSFDMDFSDIVDSFQS